MALIIYNSEGFNSIACQYAEAVWRASPPALRDQLLSIISDACPQFTSEPHPWTNEFPPARVNWTASDFRNIIQDPWMSWDMGNGSNNTCNVSQVFIKDIFGPEASLDAKLVNPVKHIQGDYDQSQLDLVRDLGGLYHYYFARTYYIDRCYGTKQYIKYYYNNFIENFIVDHINDLGDYVDETGLIKGDVLFNCWNDNSFRQSIEEILEFIKPLQGVLCSDFYQWSGQVYWWTELTDWNGLWTDTAKIASAFYNISGDEIDINESKQITPLSAASFPGYRISVNSLYSNINLPESDSLAVLFGNSTMKGPSVLQEIETPYSTDCNSHCTEDTNIITNIYSDTDGLSYIKKSYGNFKVFAVSNVETYSLIETASSCSTPGNGNFNTSISSNNIDLECTFNCANTIDVVTDIAIDSSSLNITKKTIYVLDITSSSISNIITINNCEESASISTSQPQSISAQSVICDYNANNVETIEVVTDVFIENNILKQQKASIKILKINSADLEATIINLDNCN